ncbi:MAG: transcriptional regulator [Rhodobacter sp. BACL10 MAG-121220-bin24]|nr:MAG: transcriptional regulator [Rhodobacter sp. BACL10 MAG-120910-bin24]KRO87386.1 MAG: transcriptional regulator [Rhodobacter sp. BACL10 MAG-121220-bin24]
MNHMPKKSTDEDLIKQFLERGGEVKKGKTKPMPSELGISNNNWNNKLTKEEKAIKNKK